MPDITPNLGLKKPLGNETVTRAAYNENLDIVDQNVVANKGGVPSAQAGPDANKPAPGIAGRLYIANDTQKVYVDTGTAWVVMATVNWDDIIGKPTSFTPTVHGNEAHDPDFALASDLNAHLAETVQNNVHGIKTTGNITIYVDSVNGNDNNSGSQAAPLKTINAAISRVTNLVIDYGHTITIQLAPGTYTENVIIKNLYGAGQFYLRGATDLTGADNYVIDGYVEANGCTVFLWIYGIKVLGISTVKEAITFNRCTSARVFYCKVDKTDRGHSTENYGILCGSSVLLIIVGCDISNVASAASASAAIQCFETGRVFSSVNTGSGNGIGLRCLAGTIMKNGTQPSGTTAEFAGAGGVIR